MKWGSDLCVLLAFNMVTCDFQKQCLCKSNFLGVLLKQTCHMVCNKNCFYCSLNGCCWVDPGLSNTKSSYWVLYIISPVSGQLPDAHFPKGNFPNGLFPNGQFPEDISPTDSSPKDSSQNGHFPESQFFYLFKSLFTVGIQK